MRALSGMDYVNMRIGEMEKISQQEERKVKGALEISRWSKVGLFLISFAFIGLWLMLDMASVETRKIIIGFMVFCTVLFLVGFLLWWGSSKEIGRQKVRALKRASYIKTLKKAVKDNEYLSGSET